MVRITASVLAGLVMLSTQAQAAIFKPTGATASSEFNASYVASNTIDASGLTAPGTDVTEAHDDYEAGNHWTSAFGTNPLDQSIDWSFAAPVSIGAAYIWTHRSNIIANNSGYEPTVFDLTLFDAADNVLLLLNNQALAPDIAFAQRIDFALTANVSRVRFAVEAVQSTPDFTGLAEVAFDTESFVDPVPEPASWAMLIAGFGLVGAIMRRRAAATA